MKNIGGDNITESDWGEDSIPASLHWGQSQG